MTFILGGDILSIETENSNKKRNQHLTDRILVSRVHMYFPKKHCTMDQHLNSSRTSIRYGFSIIVYIDYSIILIKWRNKNESYKN